MSCRRIPNTTNNVYLVADNNRLRIIPSKRGKARHAPRGKSKSSLNSEHEKHGGVVDLPWVRTISPNALWTPAVSCAVDSKQWKLSSKRSANSRAPVLWTPALSCVVDSKQWNLF